MGWGKEACRSVGDSRTEERVAVGFFLHTAQARERKRERETVK